MKSVKIVVAAVLHDRHKKVEGVLAEVVSEKCFAHVFAHDCHMRVEGVVAVGLPVKYSVHLLNDHQRRVEGLVVVVLCC